MFCDTLELDTRSKLFCLHLKKKGSSLKRKYLLPKGSKFFHRVDPFSEGTWSAGKQAGSRSGKGSTLKGKNLLPRGANSFLLE